jgi:hypothetical protein
MNFAEKCQMECAYCGREGNQRILTTSYPAAYSEKLTLTYQCQACKAETTLSYGLEGIQWEIDHYDEMVYKNKMEEQKAGHSH